DLYRTLASCLAVAQNPAAHARLAKLHLLGGALGRVLIKSRPIGDRRLMSAQPQRRRKSGHSLTAAWVESRMGAVAWAMRQHAVSHPRSSNRTCRSPASGSPTGFTVRHTTGQLG